MTDNNHNEKANNWRVEGAMPMLPVLSEVIPASSDLMDQLASEFAPTAAKLATQQSYWIAFNAWITNHLSAEIMEGNVDTATVGSQTWAVIASAYWGGMELREHWGMPPAMDRLGIAVKPPFAETQQAITETLAPRFEALKGGGNNCLQILPTLLHEDSGTGAIWNTAYNAGCQVIKTEDPPIGQRRPHRKSQPSMVRINTRDFLRVDYELPSPHYLRVWRSAFEGTVTTNPDAYERVIVGESGQKNLRDIWSGGVVFGNTTWGEGANDAWTNEYYNDVLQWSTVVNFGLEAQSLSAIVAVINQDTEAATRAVMSNAIYSGMAYGWMMGMLDTDGTLPKVSTG